MLKLLLTFLLACHGLVLVPNFNIIRGSSRDILRQTNSVKICSSAGTEYPLVSGFARIVFHDYIGDGGCDGCLDLSRPPNAGLIRYITILDGLFTCKYANRMSRAGFYAWLLLLGWRKLPHISKINFLVDTN